MITINKKEIEAIINAKTEHELVNSLLPNDKQITKNSSPFFTNYPIMAPLILLWWKLQTNDARAIAIQLEQSQIPNTWVNTNPNYPTIGYYAKTTRETAINRLQGITA